VKSQDDSPASKVRAFSRGGQITVRRGSRAMTLNPSSLSLNPPAVILISGGSESHVLFLRREFGRNKKVVVRRKARPTAFVETQNNLPPHFDDPDLSMTIFECSFSNLSRQAPASTVLP
jgi:hypothetical protein